MDKWVSAGPDPQQMRHAYGVDQITLSGNIVGDGSGQTIAIVDAYDDPNIFADLDTFDNQFSIDGGSENIYQQYGASTAFLSKYEPEGTPSAAPINGWGVEISLDVEWVHAMAPGAKILLTEATSDVSTTLYNAAASAAAEPGVSVVTMSWGATEYSGETSYDGDFVTPSGHNGVTFLAATGDSGAGTDGSNAQYPAYSPNVVAVGGTNLSVDQNGNYLGETGWSGSGGGISVYEGQPAYQYGTVTQSSTKRTIPDVSMDAGTGAAIYDSYDNPGSPWGDAGGTSLATQLSGAIVGIGDQGRALEGYTTLNGANDALPLLYNLPTNAYHDITSGNNGFAAGPGYDLVTGIGTPVANVLAPKLEQVVINKSGDTVADNFTVQSDGTNTQILLNSTEIFAAPTSSLAGIVLLGSNLNGSLTVQAIQADPIPSGGVTYKGGSGSNSLSVTAFASFSLQNNSLTLSGPNSGTISVRDVTQATLTDSTGNQVGPFPPGSFNVNGWEGTATLNLLGGDSATLHAPSGSSGNRFNATPTSSALSGSGYSYSTAGGSSATAIAASTSDTATLSSSSSQSGTFYAAANYAEFYGTSFSEVASQFQSVTGTAYNAGDTAQLLDSGTSTSNTFYAAANYAEFYGTAFSEVASQFQSVTGTAYNAGDAAQLHDSGSSTSNTFYAAPNYAEFYGTSFSEVASQFNSVTSTASSTAADTAQLHDDGASSSNTFYADLNYAEFYGTSFIEVASQFQSVTSTASNAGDTAQLHDDGSTSTSNTFYADPNSAEFYGTGFTEVASQFQSVTSTAYYSGDTAQLHDDGPSTSNIYYADRNYAEFYGIGFTEVASQFNSVTGIAYHSSDTAELHDDGTSTANTLYVDPTYAEFYGAGFSEVASEFGTVIGTASTSSSAGDSAQLHDNGASGNGTFYTHGTDAGFYGTGFSEYVTGFKNIVANSSLAGDNASFYDMAGTNTLDASDTTAIFSYPNGTVVQVANFPVVNAYQSNGTDYYTPAAGNAAYIHRYGTWYET
jgi:hypothetical protein